MSFTREKFDEMIEMAKNNNRWIFFVDSNTEHAYGFDGMMENMLSGPYRPEDLRYEVVSDVVAGETWWSLRCVHHRPHVEISSPNAFEGYFFVDVDPVDGACLTVEETSFTLEPIDAEKGALE
jgi:hypothetical protein